MANKYRLRMRLADKSFIDSACSIFMVSGLLPFHNSQIVFKAESDADAMLMANTFWHAHIKTKNIVVRQFTLSLEMPDGTFDRELLSTEQYPNDSEMFWQAHTDNPSGLIVGDATPYGDGNYTQPGAYL